MTGMLVGVGRIVPVGVGKTGWKGVGVGPNAGWKGVAVGLALGLAVTNVNGREGAAGVFPQAVNTVNANRLRRSVARWSDGFIGSGPLFLTVKSRTVPVSFGKERQEF